MTRSLIPTGPRIYLLLAAAAFAATGYSLPTFPGASAVGAAPHVSAAATAVGDAESILQRLIARC